MFMTCTIVVKMQSRLLVALILESKKIIKTKQVLRGTIPEC